MENTFATLDVVATAQAIYRTQGYIKKADIQTPTPAKLANSEVLKHHYTGIKQVEVTAQDRDIAKDIVAYLGGLSFKAMERGLTQFETNVLKFVTDDTATIKEIGMAASLPQVYDHKLEQDKWSEREQQLAESSEFTGELQKRGRFELCIENIRFIGRTSSYLVCASTAQDDIVKFFTDRKPAAVGSNITVTGYVKSQQISKFHGGKETMINRIKFEDL